MLKTFSKGGIHPPENKISASAAIATLPLPSEVVIPLSQHIGAPPTLMVKVGDKVTAGQCIAQGTGFVSANVHASVSGTVTKIDNFLDTSGYKRMAVQIKVEGDIWDASVDTSSTLNTSMDLSAEEILQRIRNAGVVGMGGATFPSHVKLSVPPGKKAEILVINAAECEPYLTCDYRAMLERTEEIVIGIRLLKKAFHVKKALIGIENNKPQAIAKLKEAVKEDPTIEVVPLRVKYPQGGEKQLICALVGREVPSGKLPVDVGAVPFNISTTIAVYEAVQKMKPLVERVVTVTGPSVVTPSNFKVRIGTSLRYLVEAAGGLPEDTGKIICGGPMMGKAVTTLDIPVIKGTSGVLLLPEKEVLRATAEPCLRCAKCVSVCVMGLEPYLLAKLSEKSRYEDAEAHHITDCVECGSCSFTCPSHRPLLDFIRLGKSTVLKNIRMRSAK